MQTLISSVVKRLRKVYQKAEEFIETCMLIYMMAG